MIDIDQIANLVLPDGSTDPEQVTAAAHLLAELVRRLNHATRCGRPVTTPQAADAIVSALAAATGGMPQLCTQLAARLHDVGELPGLAADNLGTLRDPTVVAAAATFCTRIAADKLTGAARSLTAASGHTSRLYIADDPAPDEEPPLPPRPILEGP
jgi:hypothetical protein